MKVQVELDHSALDHAVTCREQADTIRASISELRSVAAVLGLSDPEGEPTATTNAALARSLSTLINTQTEAVNGLDALAESCDELVAQRMVESWEELPHPAIMWAMDFVHTALLGCGMIALLFIGYIKVDRWRANADDRAVVQVMYTGVGGSDGAR
ncbi:MAG: hypothetical protein B7Y45_10565 [Sphingomonas sp. 28-66-16]|nr:MAG: hypothetical protein B7Y45_10565 [Sphingomonas sp. 28-66-16]